MDLTLEVAEHPVGGFSLDLMGKDEATGEVVIVENQLETSDHAHLGQILTYAAGTAATTIVWIASAFRPEHRAALDWLNVRTGENTRFFGVELGVVRIGESEPAPSFKLVAQPNDWGKSVRAATTRAETTGKAALYRRFWTQWIERIHDERPSWTKANQPPTTSWFPMPTGVSDVTYYAWFTKKGLSSELDFESPVAEVNSARFEVLLSRRPELETVYGKGLGWMPLLKNKSTRVAHYLPQADVTLVDQWDQYSDWLLNQQTRLREAIDRVGGLHSLSIA